MIRFWVSSFVELRKGGGEACRERKVRERSKARKWAFIFVDVFMREKEKG